MSVLLPIAFAAACGGLGLACSGDQATVEAAAGPSASATPGSSAAASPTQPAGTAATRAEAIRAEQALLEKVTHVRIDEAAKPLRTITDSELVDAFVQAFDPKSPISTSGPSRCHARLTVELTDDSGAALVTARVCGDAPTAMARFGNAPPRSLSDAEASQVRQLATGGLVARCRPTRDCRLEGRCTARGGTCMATRDADCRKSRWCAARGACTLKGSRCVVGSSRDCRKSIGCKDYGACSLAGWSCVAATDRDCRAATACREHGLCTAALGACEATPDSCRQSAGCRKRGRCTAVSNDRRIEIRTRWADLRPAVVCQ